LSVVQEKWFDHTGKEIRDEAVLRDLLQRTWFEDVPDDELLLRDLRAVKVPEMGPVVWPAYEATSVGVRSKTFTLDLGRMDDPEQRKTLARAVFLAEAAERMSDDSQQATDTAGEHESEETDTQQATDASSAGEHESTPQRGQRPIDLWVRKARDTVLTLDRKA